MKCQVIVVMAIFALTNAGTDCPRPQLENGIVSGSANANMFVGKFSCNPGYHLVGNKVVKCRQGTWTNRIPVCIKVGTCSELPEIPNGIKTLVKGSRGSMFRIKCQAGFLRLGARRLYCTGTQWSAEMPVCAKANCEVNGMESIKGGYSAKVMGGAMYRYQCTDGAEMTGSSAIYCDGTSWNDTAPTCLGAPGPVKVQTWVNGAKTNQVKVGDFVTVTCNSGGGFPAPRITIFKNFKLVADSNSMRKPYFTFEATARDNNADIACFSTNKATYQPQEDHTKLIVTFAPTKVMVGGLTQVRRGHVYKYICRSEAASPPPTLVWSVSDFRGQTKKVVVDNKEPVDVRGGWEASSSMELHTSQDEKDITVTCRAANSEGRVSQTINIKTEYMPEELVLSSPSSMSYDEEARLTCTTSPSHPTPTIYWNIIKVQGEKKEEQILVGLDAVNKEAKDGGVSIKSVLKVAEVGNNVDRVMVKCMVRLDGMEDLQSQTKNIDIRGPPVTTPKEEVVKPVNEEPTEKLMVVKPKIEEPSESLELMEPEMEILTEKLEVVQQVESDATDSEVKVKDTSSKKDTTEETTFEELTYSSWEYLERKDTLNESSGPQPNDENEEENYDVPTEESTNEGEGTLDNHEDIGEKTTKKIRWIEAQIEVTEGYYKLYDDIPDHNDEEDEDYDEPMRVQQEVPVEVVNQKASQSLNAAESKPQASKLSNSSPTMYNQSVSVLLFSSIISFIIQRSL